MNVERKSLSSARSIAWSPTSTSRCQNAFSAPRRITGSSPMTNIPLAPTVPCMVASDAEVELTGYIDNYLPVAEADRDSVRITGRSKTEDVIDCALDIHGGQFAGY